MAAFARANPAVPVIGLDIDDLPTQAAAYLTGLHATSFPSIGTNDPALLRISGYPTILAFNKNGQIVAVALGYGGTVEPAILEHELAQLK